MQCLGVQGELDRGGVRGSAFLDHGLSGRGVSAHEEQQAAEEPPLSKCAVGVVGRNRDSVHHPATSDRMVRQRPGELGNVRLRRLAHRDVIQLHRNIRAHHVAVAVVADEAADDLAQYAADAIRFSAQRVLSTEKDSAT